MVAVVSEINPAASGTYMWVCAFGMDSRAGGRELAHSPAPTASLPGCKPWLCQWPAVTGAEFGLFPSISQRTRDFCLEGDDSWGKNRRAWESPSLLPAQPEDTLSQGGGAGRQGCSKGCVLFSRGPPESHFKCNQLVFFSQGIQDIRWKQEWKQAFWT